MTDRSTSLELASLQVVRPPSVDAHVVASRNLSENLASDPTYEANYRTGLPGTVALLVAVVLVGAALLGTGIVVGLLSGGPPLRGAIRQLAIGYGATAVTYLLGLLLGGGIG